MAAIQTAGGATIHNTAVLTFTGGTASASVDVTVKTVASPPAITTVSPPSNVLANGTTTINYTITNSSSGVDTINLTGVSSDTTLAQITSVNGVSGTTASLANLGGSVITSYSQTNATTGAATVTMPAGSETGFAVNDTVVIKGIVYTITGLSPGTAATASSAEVPTSMTLLPTAGPPATLPAAGDQIGEQVTIPVTVTGQNATGSVNINLKAVTTATDSTGSTQQADTTGSAQQVTLSVAQQLVTFTKYVRNLTAASRNPTAPAPSDVYTYSSGTGLSYYKTGVTAISGDTLEYLILVQVDAASADVQNSNVTDAVPTYTTYTANSTYVHYLSQSAPTAAYPDASGGTATANHSDLFALTTTNGGITLTTPGGTTGTLTAGTNIAIRYSVTVD